MFAAGCLLLLFVCCLVFLVRCSLVVRCLLRAVCWFAFCGSLRIVRGALCFGVCCLLFAVLVFGVWCLVFVVVLFAGCCLLFVVCC